MNEIIFITTLGDIYMMHHDQDCCESVTIDDICGDINDLVGSYILRAQEVSNRGNPKADSYGDVPESFTWTFYTLSTIKGTVTIKWYGSSNGYYSEDVSITYLGKEV